MKNFKKTFYLLIMLLMIVSCVQYQSVTNYGEFNELIEVKVRFSDNNPSPIMFEGETVIFELGMPVAVEGRVEVELEVTSSDGNVEALFLDEVVFEMGEKEMTYEFTPFDDEIVESEETYILNIKEIRVELSDGSSQFFTFSGEDHSRTITVKDLPTAVVTTDGDVQVELTWVNSNFDMDLYLVTGNQSFSGSVIDASLDFTTFETVTFPGAMPDGINSIYINQYGFVASVDYILKFIFPDGQERSYVAVVDESSFVFTIEKTTNGSDIIYNITYL